MLDSRSPWYSVGARSRTDLEASSSHSLLHSIYGSQASQLLYSDYDSETSLQGTRSAEYVPPNRTRSQRTLSRPKSSPASVIAARDEQRRQFMSSVSPPRPPGTMRQRPSTAAVGSRTSGIARARPISAVERRRQQRPGTAAAGYRGGATRARSNRPASALGMRGSRGSLTQLVDLEEEPEPPPVIRDTAPVHLTRTPEYVYFWEGKPLQQRDFSVKPQKRKAWQRPKSDYGNRFLNKQKSNAGADGGGLETLVEKEDSSLGSESGTRRGSRDFGLLDRDGKHSRGDGDDLLKGSRRGSDDDKRKNRHGRSRDGSGDSDRNRGKKLKKSGFDRDKWGKKKKKDTGTTDQERQDMSTQAEDDEFFKKNDGSASPPEKESSVPSNRNLCAFDQEPVTANTTTNKENRVPVSYTRSHDLNKRNNHKSHDRSNQIVNVLQESQNVTASPRKLLASMSWMDGSGSSNSTRFELPMDMKQLEGMAPLQYLRKHCIISNRRMAHCSKVFTKLDKDKDTQITKQEMKEGLLEALHHCITISQAEDVLKLALIDNDMLVDVRLFAALCCLAERVLNLYFLPLARKEVIEMVDFEALDWKLRDCTITPSLQALFSQL